MFTRTYKTNSIPNKQTKRPTTSFHEDLDNQPYLKRVPDKSKFINRAIRTQMQLDTEFRGFALNLVQLNHGLFKHFVRQIGRANAKLLEGGTK